MAVPVPSRDDEQDVAADPPEPIVRPTAVLSAFALVLALGLASGCSGESDDAASTTDSTADSGADSGQAVPEAASAPGATTERLVQARSPAGAIVRTGSLSVQVADVPRAADEAGRLARAAGGRTDSDERSAAEDGSDFRAVLVLRLPPTAFDPTLERLSTLGTERSRQLGSTDVTDQVVDLESRLATQRASVTRLQALLAEATDVGQIVVVEGELTKRTAELESIEARLGAVQDTVALGTLTVELDGDGAVAGGALGFGDGLRAGAALLTGLARGVAILAGALVPFLPFLVVAATVTVWVVRRRRRRAAGARPGPPAAGPRPAPARPRAATAPGD